MSFSSQAAWRGVFFEARRQANLGRALWGILLLTLTCEAAGTLLVRAGMDDVDVVGGWYEALFTAVSAFCNAGFSVYSDSLMSFRSSLLIVATVALLIVAGGLGYGVSLEVLERGWRWLRRQPAHPVRWSLQARLVLGVSLALTVGGAVALFVTGLARGSGTVLDAVFQSITARTAGFNTIEIDLLPMPALLVLIALMFVGGSPGSCAGGVKTTTAAVWVARVWTRLTDREDVSVLGRRIPRDIVRRAGLVLALAGIWNLAGMLLLALTEQGHPEWGLEDLLFEQVSAFATVGLSTGVTPGLSTIGKLWIIITMFVGRLGPVTIAFAMLSRPQTLSRYPVERVMVG